ncbi:MAG: HepT-like ribonuclease domain-containing protein [Microcoleaceae cyanobacterium]
MRDVRNILAHNYFEIDLDIVWLAIEQELPSLKQVIAAILRSF